MLRSDQDYQILAFFGLVLVFEVLERLRPAREINRWKDFKIDLLSFSVAIALNRCCHYTVRKAAAGVAPHFVLSWVAWLQSLPSAAKIALALVMVDFCIYWIHRAQHRIDLLWRTHAWHHSVEQLYWFSGFRTSFFHSFLYAIPASSIPILLFNLSPLEAGVGYSIGVFIQFWEHTNIDVNIGPLKHIFITPAYHRVHHTASEHCHMNLGTTFSLWDRMFGTYVNPDTVPATVPLGLGEPIDKAKIPRMMLGV